METIEQEKTKTLIIVEIIEHIPNSVVIKTIIKKTTGSVTVSSLDSGEILTERLLLLTPLSRSLMERLNLSLMVRPTCLIREHPAHLSNTIKANVRFKMISTIIKNGYEEVI